MSHPLLGQLDRSVVTILILVILGTALVVTVPTAIDESSTEVLERELTVAPIDQTGAELETVLDLSSLDPDAPFASELTMTFPDVHRPTGTVHRWFEVPALNVREVNGQSPTFGTSLVVRAHEEIDSLSRTIDDLPASSAADVIDVAITAETAETIRASLGDEFLVTVDSTAPIPSAYPVHFDPAVLRIQRIIELTPDDDQAWFGDDRLHRARRDDTPDGFEVTAYVALHPEDLVRTPWGQRPGALVRRVDATALPGAPDSVVEAESWQRELAGIAAATAGPVEIGETVLVTRLPSLLETIADGRQSALRVTVGLLAAVASVLLVAAIGLANHATHVRRAALAVLRSRGASTRQLATTSLAAGVVIGVAGSVIGVAGALGFLAVAFRATPTPALVIGAIGVGSCVASVMFGAAVAVRSRHDLAAELGDADVRPSPVRGVVDLLLVVVAIAGAIVLRQREGPAVGIDRLAAATVAATTLAVGASARHLSGLVGRTLSRLGSRNLALGVEIGRRQLGRGSSASLGLADVVASTVVVLALAGAVLQADRDRVIDQSWEATGAEVRVDAALSRTLDVTQLTAIDGVGSVALDARLRTLVAVRDTTPSRVEVIAIDHREAQRATAGDPAHPFGFAALDELADDGSIPVLIPAAGIGRGPIAVGERIRTVTQLDPLQFTVVGTHEVRGIDGPAIVADRELVDAALGRTLDARSAWLDDVVDPADLEALADVGRVRDRSEIERSLLDDPRRRVLATGASATAAVGLVAALVTTWFAAFLTVRQRRRQSAILSAVGASRSTIRSAIAVELALDLALALVAGLVGAAIALPLVAPALDGDHEALPLLTRPLLIGLLIVVVVGVVSTSTSGRRTSAAQELREAQR